METRFGGIILLVGLFFTFSSLRFWGINTVPKDNPSAISPKNAAFIIWTPIFILSLIKAFSAIFIENANENVTSLILMSVSYIFCGLWVFFASKSNYKQAFFSIATAAVLAIVSHLFEPRVNDDFTWITQSSSAMLGSWLCLASLISLDYALPEIEFIPELPLFAIVGVSTISIYYERPLLMISLVWASFFSKKNILLSLLLSLFLLFLSVYSYNI